MPINLSDTFIGGAGSLCGSYLANPLYTAILIVLIIALILIWNYWKFCGLGYHITTLVCTFAATSILLIAHSEAIKSSYEEKYKNKASSDLIEALTNKREHDLMSSLIGTRTSQIVPQPNMVGMHQQQQPNQQPVAVTNNQQSTVATNNQQSTVATNQQQKQQTV